MNSIRGPDSNLTAEDSVPAASDHNAERFAVPGSLRDTSCAQGQKAPTVSADERFKQDARTPGGLLSASARSSCPGLGSSDGRCSRVRHTHRHEVRSCNRGQETSAAGDTFVSVQVVPNGRVPSPQGDTSLAKRLLCTRSWHHNDATVAAAIHCHHPPTR